jgi:hypothetical protein
MAGAITTYQQPPSIERLRGVIRNQPVRAIGNAFRQGRAP